MQNYVIMNKDRVIKFNNIDDNVAAVAELISVAMHGILTLIKRANHMRETIGVWGDGNPGYLTCVLLKHMLPCSEVIVFGIDEEKLGMFTFADRIVNVLKMKDIEP